MSISSAACPSGDEKVQLVGLLLETNARLARDLELRLADECNLPLAWFEVLLQLRRAEGGRLKMKDVADAIVHSTGGTTRLVDRLEEAGLVVREHCPSDRRAIYVVITNEGNQRLDAALNTHLRQLDETIAVTLSKSERDQLRSLLQKLN